MKEGAILRSAEKAADECSKRINKRIGSVLQELLKAEDNILEFDQIEKLRTEVADEIAAVLLVIAMESYLRSMWDAQKRWRLFSIADEADLLDGVYTGRSEIDILVHKNFDEWTEKIKAIRKLDVPEKEKKQLITHATGKIGESGLTYAMMRILRTEANSEVNLAARKAANKCALTSYIYHAILDDRLCEKCHQLDGKLLLWKDAQRGVNLPPLHPNCRCYTTNAAAVLYNIGFDEWRKKYAEKTR